MAKSGYTIKDFLIMCDDEIEMISEGEAFLELV
jgi:hypothetical protein